jgi:hypothetical protein
MSTKPLPGEANAVVWRWEWRLSASPAALWPLVSDTNHMNRLAGMPPVRFTTQPGPDGNPRRIGIGEVMGKPATWDEHPFKWVYQEHFSVLRTFHDGPLSAYRSTVTLEPWDGGTRLVHTVRLVPRSVLLRPVLAMANRGMQQQWERAYKAIDAFLTLGTSHPFHQALLPKGGERAQAIARTLEAAGHDAGLVERLVAYTLGEHDLAVQHIRPFALADRWRVQRSAVLELCLSAARAGLLVAQWSHMCPQCRGPVASVSPPSQPERAAHCTSCQLDFENTAGDMIELWFKPHPGLRAVDEVAFCVGGPGSTPHVVFQGELAPREERTLELAVEPGQYRLRGPALAGVLPLVYAGKGTAPERDAPVLVSALAFEGPGAPIVGPRFTLKLRNEDLTSMAIVLERVAISDEVVTMAYLSALPGGLARLTEAITQ